MNRHSERSEAEPKLQRSGRSPRGQVFHPAMLPSGIATGSLDFARDDSKSGTK